MIAQPVNVQPWLLEYFTLFRLALFFCCFGYWVVGYHWFKPRGRELPAAIMAAWVQFSIGVLLDIQIVQRGYWVYRLMPLSLGGVPLDLHVNWALIWGFFLVWLYSRLRRYWRGPGFIVIYLSGWTTLTLAFDAAMAPYLLFLSRVSSVWWLVDTVFLFIVQGVTLWVYHSILYPSQRAVWRQWSCRVRSVLYVGSLAYVFYAYLPGVVLNLTDGWAVSPLWHLNDWRVLAVAMLPPLLIGTWATLSFTDAGSGTPLPFDPPHRLVTTGPYAFVRNPMQIAGMMLAVLLVLYYPTPFMLLYVVDMGLTLSVLINLYEHGEMEQAFGDAYRHYASHVRNWLPRRSAYVAPAMRRSV